MTIRRALLWSLVLGAIIIGVTACGAEEAAAPPDTAAPRAEATGRDIYLTVGCASCHGQDAEGSAIAPSLPGHTAEQVKRQVRAPIGAMPRFGREAVSDDELDRLAQYVAGLDATATHPEPINLAPDDVVAMHHWMAISSLKADNVQEAQHHIQHAIELIEDPTHRQAMEKVQADLGSIGNLHAAEHAIESMLAGMAEPDLTTAELHLQMALSAIAAEDAEDAKHHLDHFLEDAMGSSRDEAMEAIELLEDGKLNETETLVTAMLEEMPHQHHHH